MSRIFTALAIVATLLLCVALFLGLRIGRYNEIYSSFIKLNQQLRELPADASRADIEQLQAQAREQYRQLEAPRQRASLHMLVGILAGLVAVLVNCISVTYFIGTSRWCKEVVETYQLATELAAASTSMKRRSFPWALSGILMVMLIVGLGAATDPGTYSTSTPQWVKPHLFASLFGASWIAVSFMFQVVNIRENSDIVDQILSQVRQIRIDRGLDVDG